MATARPGSSARAPGPPRHIAHSPAPEGREKVAWQRAAVDRQPLHPETEPGARSASDRWSVAPPGGGLRGALPRPCTPCGQPLGGAVGPPFEALGQGVRCQLQYQGKYACACARVRPPGGLGSVRRASGGHPGDYPPQSGQVAVEAVSVLRLRGAEGRPSPTTPLPGQRLAPLRGLPRAYSVELGLCALSEPSVNCAERPLLGLAVVTDRRIRVGGVDAARLGGDGLGGSAGACV